MKSKYLDLKFSFWKNIWIQNASCNIVHMTFKKTTKKIRWQFTKSTVWLIQEWNPHCFDSSRFVVVAVVVVAVYAGGSRMMYIEIHLNNAPFNENWIRFKWCIRALINFGVCKFWLSCSQGDTLLACRTRPSACTPSLISDVRNLEFLLRLIEARTYGAEAELWHPTANAQKQPWRGPRRPKTNLDPRAI